MNNIQPNNSGNLPMLKTWSINNGEEKNKKNKAILLVRDRFTSFPKYSIKNKAINNVEINDK